jgi:hypothetical protein
VRMVDRGPRAERAPFRQSQSRRIAVGIAQQILEVEVEWAGRL